MKLCIGTLVCAVAVLIAGVGSSRAALPQTTPTASSDKALDSRIESRIHKDAELKKYKIDVTVSGGVATLSGTVATEAERTRATQLATLKGIARVDNQIFVDLAAAGHPQGTTGKVVEKTKEAGEKTKDVGEKAVDKTKDAGEKAVDKTKEGLSKTGEVITDSWITTRVKAKFVGDDRLKDSDISVETDNHVVTLSGTVMTAAARAHAVAQAKSIEGVHRVVDKLTIGPKR
jgi:osmotically-inducible protein OsmY